MEVTHDELFRGTARLVPRCAAATYGNQKKKLLYHSIPEALRDLHTSRHKTQDLTIDLTMHDYENRRNKIKLTRANNSDLLRAAKQLMKTRLGVEIA